MPVRLLAEDRKILANSFPIDSAGCELVHTIICVAHRPAQPLFTTPQWFKNRPTWVSSAKCWVSLSLPLILAGRDQPSGRTEVSRSWTVGILHPLRDCVMIFFLESRTL